MSHTSLAPHGATHLMDRGFTASEAGRLADLKQRVLRGDYRETTEDDRRHFLRWLVETGRLNEWRVS